MTPANHLMGRVGALKHVPKFGVQVAVSCPGHVEF